MQPFVPTYFHYTLAKNIPGIVKNGLHMFDPCSYEDSPYRSERELLAGQPVGVYACLDHTDAAFWGLNILIRNQSTSPIALVVFTSQVPTLRDPLDYAARIIQSDVPPADIIGTKTIAFDVFAGQTPTESNHEDLIPVLSAHTQRFAETTSNRAQKLHFV